MARRLFEKQHGERVRLLAGGATGDPDADGFIRRLVLEQVGNDFLGDLLERLAVAEEGRHRDQQVAEQRLRFVGVVAHDVVILLQIVGAVDLHAPRDAPQHGGALVFGEIVPGAHPQMRDDPAQQFLVEIADVGSDAFLDLDQVDQPLGEIEYRQHEVGDAGGDGASRHGGIFGLVGFLYEDDAAGFLDGAHADGAVRSGAAQDYREAVAEALRHGTEEQIDRRALAARLVELQRRDLVIDHLQPPVGRNDVDVIGFKPVAAADLHYRHFGARREDLRHLAAMSRIEMHHDDERGAGAVGQGGKEALQGLNAAGRSADGDDHRLCLVVLWLVSVVALVSHAATPGPTPACRQHTRKGRYGTSNSRRDFSAVQRHKASERAMAEP